MEILKKQDSVTLHYVNTHYIKDGNEINPSYTTKSHWHRAANDTYILEYYVNYSASNLKNGDYIIMHERVLTLHCIIEDIYADAHRIIELKTHVHVSLAEYLKLNSSGYFEILNFKQRKLSELDIEREIEHLSLLKDKKTFEDQTNDDKELYQIIRTNRLCVKLFSQYN